MSWGEYLLLCIVLNSLSEERHTPWVVLPTVLMVDEIPQRVVFVSTFPWGDSQRVLAEGPTRACATIGSGSLKLLEVALTVKVRVCKGRMANITKFVIVSDYSRHALSSNATTRRLAVPYSYLSIIMIHIPPQHEQKAVA
jgi:hypothetical protein